MLSFAGVPAAVAGPDTRPMGWLVVEPEPMVRHMLAAALGRRGLRAWTTGDPDAAVAVVREHGPALGTVLLDTALPPVGGPALWHRLAVAAPHLTAAFTVGSCGEGEQPADLFRHGAAAVLSKPFGLRALDALIDGLSAARP